MKQPLFQDNKAIYAPSADIIDFSAEISKELSEKQEETEKKIEQYYVYF